MQSALEELKALTGVRGVWFRLDGGGLVEPDACGLSSDFLRDAGSRTFQRRYQQIVGTPLGGHIGKRDHSAVEVAGMPCRRKDPPACDRTRLGNKAPVGLLMLGTSSTRRWTSDELAFFEACAKQLAVAVENFRLLEQVLRSQRQWVNTFDSVHDIILAHDADYRVIKANQACLSNSEKRLRT